MSPDNNVDLAVPLAPRGWQTARVAQRGPLREVFHRIASDDHARHGEEPMPELVLPQLPHDTTSTRLPANPHELLSTTEHKELTEGLARLARLRRDAETASASLRLA